MLTRGVLLMMMILVKSTRASYSINLENCQGSDNQLWKNETVRVRDNVAFIHNCRIYAREAKLPFILSYCMKNSEAHLSIPGSMRILRVELLNDLIEWCTVKERLFIEGTQITLEQYFDCEAYSPKKTDDIRVYIACDPYFGHPLIVVILKPFRETPFVTYLEFFFYGWCISIVLSATLLLLLIAVKPELIVVQHNEMSEYEERSKRHRYTGGGSLRDLEAAKLKALSSFTAKSKKSTPVGGFEDDQLNGDAAITPNREENFKKQGNKEDKTAKQKSSGSTKADKKSKKTANQKSSNSTATGKKPKHQKPNEKASQKLIELTSKFSETRAKYGAVKEKKKGKTKEKVKRS